MDISAVLAIGQAGSSIIGGELQKKASAKIAKKQRGVELLYQQYNKKQIEKAYALNYKNMMLQHIKNRNNLFEQRDKAQSNLAINAVQQGLYVSNSSVANDLTEQLNLKFETTLQDMYGKEVNNIAKLIEDSTVMAIQNDRAYDNKINAIDTTLSNVEDKVNQKMFNDFVKAGSNVYTDYKDFKATDIGEDTVKKYLTSFNL